MALNGGADFSQDFGDLHAINTQDLILFDPHQQDLISYSDAVQQQQQPPMPIAPQYGEVAHTLSDLESILDLGQDVKEEEQQALQHWKEYPNLEAVPTAYDFDIHIEMGEKFNWLYSAKLDKVYIKLNSVMHLAVSYVPHGIEPLHVRAMIVFSRREEMHLPVTRCPNHRMLSSGKCYTEVPAFHILKCCNPGTEYFGIENGSLFGQRASLAVPLTANAPSPAAALSGGRVQQSLGLEFLCQNSCANGIQRKQTVLVFTLENERGQILGKRVMPFKVCSCPKRDMSKEMNSAQPSRKRPANGAPPTTATGGGGGGKQPANKLVKLEAQPATTMPSPPASNNQQQQQPMVSPGSDATNGSNGGSQTTGSPQSEPDVGTAAVVVRQVIGAMDSFKFESNNDDDDDNNGLSPGPRHMTPPGGGVQRPGGTGGSGGPYAMQIVMPTRESAQRLLRSAYNEVCGEMARDKQNSLNFLPFAREIEKYANENNLPI